MKFKVLCDLLSTLESIAVYDPPLLPKSAEDLSRKAIVQWFQKHRVLIDDPNSDAVALLSALLPQRRTDRVYNFQPPSLTRAIGRCLSLGSSRQRDLGKWKQAKGGDLATCVERVLREAEHSIPLREVTVAEIDHVLNEIARRSRFSGPSIRGTSTESIAVSIDTELATVYHRLQSREAKWFTRMILKDLSPIELPESLVLRCFHHLLPPIMKVHDNFHAAIAKLRSPELGRFASTVNTPEMRAQKNLAAINLAPVVGTKIGRPCFLKARSIKHAVELAHGRKMSLERKYDGEYCQVHIDLQKTGKEIQIFSKSAKDSTVDRASAHSTIMNCLRVGEDNCGFSNQCILEGELLVWHDDEKRIMDFHKIRKHVSRSGSFLGIKADSQQHPWERLIVVFYDLMLIDGESMLNQSYSRRRKRLKSILTSVAGRPVLSQCKEIDFTLHNAPNLLVQALAVGFARKWEGFVLKPSEEPYINLEEHPRHIYPCCWIKLKKDYIPNLGDTVDLAIVGAGYRASKGAKATATSLPFTHFHIGCLVNKTDVLQCGAKPKFLILDAFNQCIGVADLRKLCQLGEFQAVEINSVEAKTAFDSSFSAQSEYECRMDVVFPAPFVFEMLCSGFDKPANRDYLTPRFPRLLKIHWDRDFKDALSFTELQSLAAEAMKTSDGDLSDDVSTWTRRLNDSVKGNQRLLRDFRPSDDNLDPKLMDGGSDSVGSPSRLQLSRPPFMVRTDTQEMPSARAQLKSGEMISKQPSFHTSLSDTFTETLLTPPDSSKKDSCQAQQKDSGTSLKRPSADIENTSNTRQSIKRLHVQDPAVMRNQGAVTSELLPGLPISVRYARPLEVIINSARPIRHQVHAKAPGFTGISPTFPGGQACKIGTEVRQYAGKRQATSGSSSAGATSTASESSISPQDSLMYTVPISAPCLPPRSPLYTATAPMITKPLLPNFWKSIFILSPCISQITYINETLCHPSKGNFIRSEDVLVGLPAESPDKQMILLVESHRYKPTADFLLQLLFAVRGSKKSVEVWDWRVLKDQTSKGKLFVGCLWINGKVEASIHWSDGHVTRFGL